MKSIRIVVSEQWKLFCTSTGLRGFLYLNNSTTLVERLLWLMTIAVGVFMTTFDVTNSFLNYASKPTLTKLEMRNEKPYKLDNVTLCIQYKDENIQNFGMNLSDLDQVDQFLVSFQNDNITRFWDEQTSLITNYLKNMTIADGANGLILSNTVDDKFPKLVYLTFLLITQTMRAQLYPNLLMPNGTTMVQKFYNQRNIRPVDILQQTGRGVLCAVGFFSGHKDLSDKYNEVAYCHSNKITWIGPNPFFGPHESQFCFGIDTAQLTFYSRTNRLRWKFRYGNFFVADDNTISVHFHLSPELLTFPEMENLFTFDLGMSNTAFLKKVGEYQLMPEGKYHCQQERSLVKCKLQRLAKCIEERNFCSPLFVRFMNEPMHNGTCDAVSYKTDVKFDAIQSWTTSYELNTKCSQDCSPPCLRKLSSLAQKSWPPKTNVTRLELIIDSYIYPYFEEVSAVTFRQLLAQLGGNLSLWIGASFLIILHLVVFIFKLPVAFM